MNKTVRKNEFSRFVRSRSSASISAIALDTMVKKAANRNVTLSVEDRVPSRHSETKLAKPMTLHRSEYELQLVKAITNPTMIGVK